MTHDLELLLDGFPALRDLPPEPLLELQKLLTRRTVSAGEYLFHQGQGPPSHAFYLVSATAETLVGPQGAECPVSRSLPGQLLGWLTVFTTDLFPVSARIVEAGDVIQLASGPLRELLDRHPPVGRIFASAMARHLKALLQKMPTETAGTPYRQAETYPFRKKVNQVMSTPVLTLPPDATAREAASAMARDRVGSVVVADGQVLHGIITDQDMVRQILAKGRNPDTTALASIMSAPVVSLGGEEYLYKAMDTMRRRKVRHLPVAETGELVGILSLGSLLALATGETLGLAEHIEDASSLAALAEAHSTSHALCAQLSDQGVPADEVSRLLSHINRDLHRRVLEVSISAMDAEGHGKPPVPFCFILMGSHGRGENHLCTDQDHGMILADYPEADWQWVEPYFMELGSRVSEADIDQPPGQET